MSWQNIVSIALYVCGVAGLVCYSRMSPTYLRAFAWWVWVYALGDIALYLFFKQVPNGLLVPMVYCTLDPFGFLAYAYVLLLRPRPAPWLVRITLSIFVGFFIFAVYQLAFVLENQTSANTSFLLRSVLVLVVVLSYFWELIRSEQVIILSREPLFWIATPSLFYFAGNIIATGFFHQLYAHSSKLADALYLLNYILELVMYLLFTLAFILSVRKKK